MPPRDSTRAQDKNETVSTVAEQILAEFEAMPWGDVLELLRGTSLRALLDRIKADVDDVVGRLLKEAADLEAGRQRTRGAVLDRIALRDQAILNTFQGEIFRLPGGA